jgi:hypothetical protein
MWKSLMSFLFIIPLVSLSYAENEKGKAKIREFHADISASNQTRYTESKAKGRADFKLNLESLTLSWEIFFEKNILEPTSINLHGPAQPGANGVVFLELASTKFSSPINGSAKLNEAQIQYLLAGWTYINVATKRYPFGEARGQLDVGPR